MLRAPSAGLASQYEAAARRAVRCLRQWVDGDTAAAEAPLSGAEPPLLSLPGAGAAELQLATLCDAAAADSDAALGRGMRDALCGLAAALRSLPRRLHDNAGACAATAAGAGAGRTAADGR